MSVVGIDPSVNAPAFACWPSCETWQYPTSGEGAARLLSLYDLTIAWAELFTPPDLEAVFIERPVGKFPKRSLDHACGVLQVAILKGVASHFDYPVSCFELSPGEWKKAILGNGAATKQEVYAWARNCTENDPTTQDQADAMAIAAAGSMLLRTDRMAA